MRWALSLNKAGLAFGAPRIDVAQVLGHRGVAPLVIRLEPKRLPVDIADCATS